MSVELASCKTVITNKCDLPSLSFVFTVISYISQSSFPIRQAWTCGSKSKVGVKSGQYCMAKYSSSGGHWEQLENIQASVADFCFRLVHVRSGKTNRTNCFCHQSPKTLCKLCRTSVSEAIEKYFATLEYIKKWILSFTSGNYFVTHPNSMWGQTFIVNSFKPLVNSNTSFWCTGVSSR